MKRKPSSLLYLSIFVSSTSCWQTVPCLNLSSGTMCVVRSRVTPPQKKQQIRASNTSGECSFNMEVRRGNLKWGGQQKECVKRRAELSLKATPGCEDRVSQSVRPTLYCCCDLLPTFWTGAGIRNRQPQTQEVLRFVVILVLDGLSDAPTTSVPQDTVCLATTLHCAISVF